jgi:hypothetical protein
MKSKKAKSMDELTKGYEKFIASKKTHDNNGNLFEKVIKKAAKTKPHSAK